MLSTGRAISIAQVDRRADGAVWVEQRNLHSDERIRARQVGSTHATESGEIFTVINAQNGSIALAYVAGQEPELAIELGREDVSNDDHVNAGIVKRLTTEVHRNAQLALQLATGLGNGKFESVEDAEMFILDHGGDKDAVFKLLAHSGKTPVVLQTALDSVVIGGVPQCPSELRSEKIFKIRGRFQGHTSLNDGSLRIYLQADPALLQDQSFEVEFGKDLAMTLLLKSETKFRMLKAMQISSCFGRHVEVTVQREWVVLRRGMQSVALGIENEEKLFEKWKKLEVEFQRWAALQLGADD